jgi:hypothetical protein
MDEGDFGGENGLDSPQNRWDGALEEGMQVELDESDSSAGEAFEEIVDVEMYQGEFEVWNGNTSYDVDVDTAPGSKQGMPRREISPTDRVSYLTRRCLIKAFSVFGISVNWLDDEQLEVSSTSSDSDMSLCISITSTLTPSADIVRTESPIIHASRILTPPATPENRRKCNAVAYTTSPPATPEPKRKYKASEYTPTSLGQDLEDSIQDRSIRQKTMLAERLERKDFDAQYDEYLMLNNDESM